MKNALRRLRAAAVAEDAPGARPVAALGDAGFYGALATAGLCLFDADAAQVVRPKKLASHRREGGR